MNEEEMKNMEEEEILDQQENEASDSVADEDTVVSDSVADNESADTEAPAEEEEKDTLEQAQAEIEQLKTQILYKTASVDVLIGRGISTSRSGVDLQEDATVTRAVLCYDSDDVVNVVLWNVCEVLIL